MYRGMSWIWDDDVVKGDGYHANTVAPPHRGHEGEEAALVDQYITVN